MIFREIYTKINEANLEARKGGNGSVSRVTSDLKLRFTDADKYGHTTDLEAMKILKKTKGEYEATYSTFGVAPYSKLRTETMNEAAKAITYIDQFIPKPIKDMETIVKSIGVVCKNILDNREEPLSMKDMGSIIQDVNSMTQGAIDGKLLASYVMDFIKFR